MTRYNTDRSRTRRAVQLSPRRTRGTGRPGKASTAAAGCGAKVSVQANCDPAGARASSPASRDGKPV